MDKLLHTMVENLKEMYQEDDSLNNEDEYLLSKVQTFADLYHYLKTKDSFHVWDVEDVYGFLLNLVKPDCGIDTGESLSDQYRKAYNNVEIEYGYTGDVWGLDIG